MNPRIPLLVALTTASALAPRAHAQRALGVDVSDWQGPNINWATAAKPVSQGGANISFAFIRASRGGTTGTYDEVARTGTLSQRYDDLYLTQNMAGTKAAGILAGTYHFARADIVTNTGADEGNHFLQTAGIYMRPGYLRPVLDLEAGNSQRTRTALTNFALEFSDTIFNATGVRPLVYINSSYATDEVDARLNTHDMWLARWVDPTVVNIQTVLDPPAASGYPNVYGVWNPTYPTLPAQRPWDFWQYKSTGPVAGIGNPVDQDIANGDIEFVKDFLVPAIWTSDASGAWNTAANWNSVTYLPSANDRVIINRSAAAPFVSFGTITANIRSLQLNEDMAIGSGTLNVSQYVNVSSQLSVNAGTLNAGSINNAGTLRQQGGITTTAAITGNGSIEINGSGILKAASVQQLSLSITGGRLELTGTGTSRVNSFSMAIPGKLYLGNAKLIVDYVSTSPIESVRNALQNGSIIVAPGTPSNIAVAYFQAGDLFTAFPASWGGATIDATSLLLTRALRGDTNANGVVDFSDLVSLAQSYGGSGRWINGDFDYDGNVTFTDLVSLAQTYNGTLLDAGSLVAGDNSTFDQDWLLAQSLVPEPATLTLFALPAMLMRRRR